MANQQLQPLNHPNPNNDPPRKNNYFYDADLDGDVGSSTGCFRLLCCFGRRRHDGETAGFLYQQQSGDLMSQDTWFMKRAKSVKEYSELVAGPKWKNFIRRFSRKPKTRSNANTTPFQYDPQSYALNFNDGGGNHEDDDLLPRSFSTRFAPPSRSSQM
ncbi:hypothetical protein SSX86_011221 [Deinandra increscens subsp. villosa]|uniref:Uncharacterized protein n=1 Tax=Deinandra increscens subsp. villosa TaxID=3103831 RepID=A0AAP0DD70_9ASTR